MLKNRNNVIFEFIRVGHSLKVTAIDEATGTEASIVGDPKATQTELASLKRMKKELKELFLKWENK